MTDRIKNDLYQKMVRTLRYWCNEGDPAHWPGKEYLVELLGVLEQFDDIDFDKLPNRFVLKCNHGSGMNVIVTDKKRIDRGELKRKFDAWIEIDFYACNFEPQYRGIKRKIIAEEYLTNLCGDLYDYKFWCNNGHCDFIVEAQTPAFPMPQQPRCRSSQELNGSPTPFPALYYFLLTGDFV